MARQNLTFLLGSVLKKPQIVIDDTTNEKMYASCFINIVRSVREVGDHKRTKTDNPILMTRDLAVMNEMESWQENDIVMIKGTIACKMIKKGSYCPKCGKKNLAEGALVYVNPIYAKKIHHAGTLDEGLQYLMQNREVSNQIFVFGTICKAPKKLRPKEGLLVCQYQIVLERKYRIRTDPPEIKTDYPWVKSYGKNAEEDSLRLHTGSQVFIDGCLQARSVQRKHSCVYCGSSYTWRDRAMEIVPHETEYIANYYTDSEVEEMKKKKNEAIRDSVLKGLSGYEEEVATELTDEEREEGFSDEE